jgi:hypothetical protein
VRVMSSRSQKVCLIHLFSLTCVLI